MTNVLFKMAKTEEEKRVKGKNLLQRYLMTLAKEGNIADRKYAIKPSFFKRSLTVEELENLIIGFKDADLLLDYVRNVKCADVQKISKVAVQLKSGKLIYALAQIKGADLEFLSAGMANTGDSFYMQEMAKNIKGANIEALSKGIAQTQSCYAIYDFMKEIKGANLEMLLDSYIEKMSYNFFDKKASNYYYETYAEQLLDMAHNIPGINIEKICMVAANRIPQIIYDLAKTVPGVNMKILDAGFVKYIQERREFNKKGPFGKMPYFDEIYNYASIKGTNLPLKELLSDEELDERVLNYSVNKIKDGALLSKLIAFCNAGYKSELAQEILFRVALKPNADVKLLCQYIQNNWLNLGNDFIYNFAKKIPNADAKILSRAFKITSTTHISDCKTIVKFANEISGADIPYIVENICKNDEQDLYFKFLHLMDIKAIRPEYVYPHLPEMIEKERKRMDREKELYKDINIYNAVPPVERFISNMLIIPKMSNFDLTKLNDALKQALKADEYKKVMDTLKVKQPKYYGALAKKGAIVKEDKGRDKE